MRVVPVSFASGNHYSPIPTVLFIINTWRSNEAVHISVHERPFAYLENKKNAER